MNNVTMAHLKQSYSFTKKQCKAILSLFLPPKIGVSTSPTFPIFYSNHDKVLEALNLGVPMTSD